MKKIFTFFILLTGVAGVGFTQESTLQSKLSEADSLYEKFHEEKALNLYESVLKQDPDHYTALWRSSFLYSRIGYRLDSEDRQRNYYNTAIALAKRALQVDSTDAQSNFVMSVAQGRKAMISGARERVAASRSIKRYASQAIRLDSTHAGAWHVLGRWHLKVANLNFVERAAANTLFGGLPQASEQNAVHALEKALELNPQYILYYYDLARAYKQIGKEDQAVATCRKALQREPLTPGDPRLLNQCEMLIQSVQ